MPDSYDLRDSIRDLRDSIEADMSDQRRMFAGPDVAQVEEILGKPAIAMYSQGRQLIIFSPESARRFAQELLIAADILEAELDTPKAA